MICEQKIEIFIMRLDRFTYEQIGEHMGSLNSEVQEDGTI